MKETIKKSFVGGIVFSLTVLLFGLTYAAYTPVSNGDTLTATLWNDLQAKVDGITSEGTGYIRVGNIQIAWGETGVISGGGSEAITFPQPFIEVPKVTISSVTRDGYNISAGNGGTDTRTTTGFTARAETGNTNKGSWIAIGRWQ